MYLVTALMLRIRRGRGNWTVLAALGALLGLGYLAKAAMVALSFVFLSCAFCLCWIAGASFRAVALRPLLTAAVFARFALPQLVSRSRHNGRRSVGALA